MNNVEEKNSDSDGQLDRLVMCDAPIRDGVHEDSLCKFCTRILQDCRHVHKSFAIEDGYKVVVDCEGFIDFRYT